MESRSSRIRSTCAACPARLSLGALCGSLTCAVLKRMHVAERASGSEFMQARLAVLATRAWLAGKAQLAAADLVRIQPSPLRMSLDAAARALARMPKPLLIHACVEDGLPVLACRVPEPEEMWRLRAADRDAFPDLRRSRPGSYPDQVVYCIGYHESLVIRVADFEAWLDTYLYDLGSHTWSAGPASSEREVQPRREARALGAAYCARFYFGPPSLGTINPFAEGMDAGDPGPA